MKAIKTIQRGVARNAKLLLAAGAAVLALGATQGAQAQAYQAYITDDAPLMSGPSPDYPPVSNIYQNEPVTVFGCLEGYSWCDVQAEDVRGWVDASLLTYPYEGRQVPLYDYGYRVGLPIIGFSFGDYWGRFYHDRPFFRDRDRFIRIAPAPRGAIAHFQGRDGFQAFRGGGFDRRPNFQQGRSEQARPEQGRQDFQRGPQGGEQGRPQDGRVRGPQPDQQRVAPEQQRAGPERAQPQPQAQHMQGPPSHERYVGAGAPPQQGGARPGPAPQQAPRPQAAPAQHPQAAPPQGAPHPQGGQNGHPQDNGHQEHPN